MNIIKTLNDTRISIYDIKEGLYFNFALHWEIIKKTQVFVINIYCDISNFIQCFFLCLFSGSDVGTEAHYGRNMSGQQSNRRPRYTDNQHIKMNQPTLSRPPPHIGCGNFIFWDGSNFIYYVTGGI